MCGLALAAVAPALTVAPARAEGTRASTVIRIYDASGASRADRLAAMVAAGAILGDAGVEVAWLDCSAAEGRDSGAPVGCARPPSADDLLMRLVRAPVWATPESLGYSYVDTDRGQGQLATIYMDRVTAFGRVGPVGVGVVLGRVMAHEAVHLLLGTVVHASAGLMRDRWSIAELQAADPDDWRVAPRDIETLHQRRQARRSPAAPGEFTPSAP